LLGQGGPVTESAVSGRKKKAMREKAFSAEEKGFF